MAELSIFNIFALAALAGVVWYFFDAMRAREMATAIVREYCKQSGLQFLDGTVGLRTVTPSLSGGRLTLRRRYEFHYSESDHSRNIGVVLFNGSEVENFILQNQFTKTSKSNFEA